MEGRDTPNNLLSFAEESSQGEHSRPSSHRRPQPRLQSASSKGRNVPSGNCFYQSASNRLKSSFVTLKYRMAYNRDIKKARLEEREDNLPTLQFDQVKWIPIIKAYDPSRLKNITIKKKSFEEFFGRHNPKDDPLGQLYIQPIIEHFKQWQAKLNRRYGRILDTFLGSSEMPNCEQIETELAEIEKMTQDLKEILKTILKKYENHRIRNLIEGFQRNLEKADEIMTIIDIIYESKKKMQKMLERLEGRKDIRQVLRSIQKKDVQQTREVFRNHPPNRFEDEIVQRVAQAISSMANMTVEGVDQLQSMKHIVERIQRILQNRQQNMGLKGLDQINQIFESVLDQARVFQESSARIHQNTFFNEEFKKKVQFYELEMKNKKTMIIEYIFGMVDSILGGMVETFEQYQSLVEPLQRQPQSFGLMKTGLRNIARNLKKEELPQGTQLLQFVDSISKHLQTLKTNTQQLHQLKQACSGKHFDDYADLLKKLGGFSNGYKQNIRQLISMFSKMRSELNTREGNRLGRLKTQPRDEGPDLETQYIERLHKLCLFFQKHRLQGLQIFSKRSLDIFKQADIAAVSAEYEDAEKMLQRMQKAHTELKELLKNNEIREITGEMPIRSKLLANFSRLEALFREAALVRQDTYKERLPACRVLFQQLLRHQAQVQPAYDKLLLIRLSHLLSPQSLAGAVSGLQKSIEEGKDCSEQVKLLAKQQTFVRDVLDCLASPEDTLLIEQVQRVAEQYSYLISIHTIKTRLDRRDNLYFPNVQFLAAAIRQVFSWLFVLRDQPLAPLHRFLAKKYTIMQRQQQMLRGIEQLRAYREVKTIHRQVDSLVEDFGTLKTAFKKFTDVVNKCSRSEVVEDYLRLVNSCLTYLTATKQLFFCLLTKKNQPLYLSLREDSDCIEVVSNFLTCVGLPPDKQWLGRLKSDWKQEVYKPPVKSDISAKQADKKKKTANATVSPRPRGVDEPGELIEVEPDEVIDFDLEARGDENIAEQDIAEQDIAEEEIEDNIGEDMPGQDMPEEPAEEDIQMEEDIPAEEAPLEQDMMESEHTPQPAKNISPLRVARPESASPKRPERERTEPLEKLLKQREQQRRHLKPLFIKMSKLESVAALLESLSGYDSFNDFHKGLVQPLLYQQMINKLFMEMVIERNKQPVTQPLLQPCRQNCKRVSQGVQKRLSANILKDFICTQARYRRLTAIMRDIEEKLGGDSPTVVVLYKLGGLLQDLMSALGMTFGVIRNSSEQVCYVSQSAAIGEEFVAECVQKYEVKLNQQQRAQVAKLVLKPIQLQDSEPASDVLVLTQHEKLNSAGNNRICRQLRALFTFDNYIALYELRELHLVFEGILEGTNQHDNLIADQVRTKNAAKLQVPLQQLDGSLMKLSSQLQQELSAYRRRIKQAEDNLRAGGIVSDRIKVILNSWLMRGNTFKVCVDAETGEYFMLSMVEPEGLVRRLVGRIANSPNSKFLKLVKPSEQKQNTYHYDLKSILEAVEEELATVDRSMQSKWEQFYSAINDQLLRQRQDYPPALKKSLSDAVADLQQLLQLEHLNTERLQTFLKAVRSKCSQKQQALQFLDEIPVASSWDQYNVIANKLLSPKLLLDYPATLTYCDGVLYRIYPRMSQAEIAKLLGRLLYNNDRIQPKVLEERRSNGAVIINLPSHTAKFVCSHSMDRIIRYVGQGLNLKIACRDKDVYSGKLQESVDLNYIFPEMKDIEVTLLKNQQILCSETIGTLLPYQRLISDKLNTTIKNLIEQKIEQEEEERRRLEEERREKERREFEERERIRKQKELEELMRRQEQERLRLQEEQRLRKQEEKRFRKQEEERLKKQEDERLRRLEQEKLQKQQDEQQALQRESQLKQARVPQSGQEQHKKRLKELLKQNVPRYDKTALQTKPKPQQAEIATQSRQAAMRNPQFTGEYQQLLDKDIMLKTPEEIIVERSCKNLSELGVNEQLQDSITPSEGFDPEDLKGRAVPVLNFEEIRAAHQGKK